MTITASRNCDPDHIYINQQLRKAGLSQIEKTVCNQRQTRALLGEDQQRDVFNLLI